MKLSEFIRQYVFDWKSEPPSRSTRPPQHDPGWENRKRAKKLINKRSAKKKAEKPA